MTRTLALALAAATLAACATVRSEHVLTGTPGAEHSGAVKIAMEGSPVAGQYDEVAIVSAVGTGEAGALPSVLNGLTSEAAKLGCNAVIHVRYDRGAQSATATGIAVRMR